MVVVLSMSLGAEELPVKVRKIPNALVVTVPLSETPPMVSAVVLLLPIFIVAAFEAPRLTVPPPTVSSAKVPVPDVWMVKFWLVPATCQIDVALDVKFKAWLDADCTEAVAAEPNTRLLPVKVFVLYVPEAVTLPLLSTLNLLVGVEPERRSSKLPDGEALVFSP